MKITVFDTKKRGRLTRAKFKKSAVLPIKTNKISQYADFAKAPYFMNIQVQVYTLNTICVVMKVA